MKDQVALVPGLPAGLLRRDPAISTLAISDNLDIW